MLIFISIKGMYFMSDMEINKMNKQREVSILMQNTLSILLNISIGISVRKRLR